MLPEHYDERAWSSAKNMADLLCHSSSKYYGERISAMLERVNTPTASTQPLWSEDVGEAASFWDWVQQGGGLPGMTGNMNGVAGAFGQGNGYGSHFA